MRGGQGHYNIIQYKIIFKVFAGRTGMTDPSIVFSQEALQYNIELARKVIKLFYLQELRTKQDINKFISFVNSIIDYKYILLYAEELGVDAPSLSENEQDFLAGLDIKALIVEYILQRAVRDGLLSDEEYIRLPQLRALHKIKAIFRREYFVEIMLTLFKEYFVRCEDELYFILPTHIIADGESILKALADTLGSIILSIQERKRFIEQFKVHCRTIDKKEIEPRDKLLTKHGILDLNTLKLTEFEYKTLDVNIVIDPPYFTQDEPFPGFFKAFDDNAFVKIIRRFYDDKNWDLLLRTVGALLSPYPQRLIVIVVGPPRTGKTLLQIALSSAVVATAIDLKELQEYRFSGEALLGRRAIITTEKPTDVLNIDVLKRLVGGDIITVHRKFKKPVEIQGNFIIFILANELPQFEKFDDALADRIVIIETQNPISYTEADETLYERVRTEMLEDAASFILQAYKYFLEHNKEIPRDPELVKQLLIQSEFRLQAFVDDMCEQDPEAKVLREELYNAFVEWAQQNPEKVERIYTRRQFYAMMRKKFAEIVIRGKYYFKGIRLRKAVDNYAK